jgi:hypothetical protein
VKPYPPPKGKRNLRKKENCKCGTSKGSIFLCV